MQFTASTVLQSVCDRCLKPFDNPKSVRCEYMLAEELSDERNDEIVLLEDGVVDVGDLARTAFILEMDTKTLCSEDCKGICPGCGVNLNQGSCTCKKEVDPGWRCWPAFWRRTPASKKTKFRYIGGVIMAVPKGKVSKARRDKRRSSVWKLKAPGLTPCPKCGAMRLPHRMCPECGTYNGRQVKSAAAEE